MTFRPISRRTVLRGLGAAVALPWLEAMRPVISAAQSAERPHPNRLAFLYVPNGKNMVDWTPAKEGTDWSLTPILEPLAPVKDKLLVLTGLTADKARPHGDGGGDHARALGAFLTGCQPRKTDGTDIRAGVSVDQVAAGRLGHLTRLPSIEIGCEAGAMAGNCDSGYSCVYSSTMSWKSATTPLPKEVNPKLVFDRLFSSLPDQTRVERDKKRKSILDFVQADAGGLMLKVSGSDRRKLDEYFSAIRDVERAIAQADKLPPVKAPEGFKVDGPPAEYQAHIRILADLMVLAFQADVTRVGTFVLANEGSNRPYPFINVKDGHHDLSHHGRDKSKLEKIREINKFHVTQLSYFLQKLASVKEGDGTLLDHCMIAYGSGNSDGDRHNHDDLPILVAGGGCGTLKTGRHIKYSNETPLNNLWLALLQRMEVQVGELGDSTGVLDRLAG